ncbi:MAG: YcxB family protein [Pseudomonadales bacterium]
MNQPLSYSTNYILNKAHFQECYSESVLIENSYRAYFKAIILTAIGTILITRAEMNSYVAWFIFCLGILEAFSVYYKQPWWVMRQMLSKAYNSEVSLTIDESGIFSQSLYADLSLSWSQVHLLKKTKLGWIVIHDQGRNYISNHCLSEAAQDFLTTKVTADCIRTKVS